MDGSVWGALRRRGETIYRSILWIATGIGAISIIVKALSWVVDFGNRGPFRWLTENWLSVIVPSIAVAVGVLYFWTSTLRRRFVSGFADNFGAGLWARWPSGNLRANWDLNGLWRIPEKGTLLVTGEEAPANEGIGITKVGAFWENYTFTFSARIIKECLGVIVRAQDLHNFYMFQIRTDRIVPHIRKAIPTIATQPCPAPDEAPKPVELKPDVRWYYIGHPVHLSRRLDDWFDVRLTVRGESVALYIDGDLILQEESLIKIPSGKVGFRN